MRRAASKTAPMRCSICASRSGSRSTRPAYADSAEAASSTWMAAPSSISSAPRRRSSIAARGRSLCSSWCRREASRVVAVRERLGRAARAFDQRGRVREPLLFLVELLPLAGREPQPLELADLPGEPVALEGDLALASLGRVEVAGQRAPRGPGVADGAGLVAESGVGVEQLALAVGAQQRLRCVLAVDVDQSLAELAQQRGGGRVAIHQRARAPLGVDHPAQQHAARVAGELALGQPGVERLAAAEACADVGARRAFADHAGVGAPAHRQRQGVEQDRLARAGLAGEHREARAELDVERIDDDEVAKSQREQHRGAGQLRERIGSSCQFSLLRSVAK